MLAMANGIFGTLGDVQPETSYKERSKKTDDLEKYFLQYAREFDCEDIVNKGVLDDDFYINQVMNILDDYEEFTTQSNLANKLAKRDMRKDFTPDQIEKMVEENNGYLGVELYDYEKKYWDEFEENDFDRLVIHRPNK